MTTQATAIRDAIYTRLSALPGYLRFDRTPMPSMSNEDVPRMGIFIMREELIPDGDGNAAEPRFTATVTIGVSILRGFDDPVVTTGQIDSDVDTIENMLFTDITFVNFGPNCLFESVERISRQRLYPTDGEAYFCELRLEIDFLYRFDFQPNIPNDFSRWVVTPSPAFPV